MALYWIGYDLEKPGQDYSDLINRLKEIGAYRALRSDWLLPNTASAKAIRDDLLRFLDNNDRIIVAELKNHAAWRNLLISDDTIKTLFTNHAG